MNSSLRQLVISVGEICSPLTGAQRQEMFLFHQHIHVCEQDMGYRILGVKITMRLTAYLLTTLVSLLVALINLKKLDT